MWLARFLKKEIFDIQSFYNYWENFKLKINWKDKQQKMKVVKFFLKIILKIFCGLFMAVHFIATRSTFKPINPEDYYDDTTDIKNNNWD